MGLGALKGSIVGFYRLLEGIYSRVRGFEGFLKRGL